MPSASDVLTDLAVILCVAAVTTVLFQRIRQPVVLGYLLAGLIIGPHVPVPLFASTAVAHTLSELGVILLMFSLGLEFRFKKLVRIAPTAGVVAVIECSLMVWFGYMAGRAFGWTSFESLFVGAMVAISSTTIIAKAFGEQKVTGRPREIVLGILIVEDLIAIILLTVLTAAASGAGLSAWGLAAAVGRLTAFLVGLLVVGMFVVPRLMRFIVRLGRTETTVVASIGLSFAFALLARKMGYSVALGAFLAGALVAESGEARRVETLIEPVRDMFAAVFFVSVGMLIDPELIISHWTAVLTLVVVVVGKVAGVSIGAFIAGHGLRSSIRASMSLAQIGEFSFIIAGLGVSLGVVGDFVYPTAVAVSAVTTLFTPWLIRASGAVADYVDQRLPRALQTYATLYGSWVQSLRATPSHPSAWGRIRRMALLLLLDELCLAAIIIGVSVSMPWLVNRAESLLNVAPGVARIIFVVLALALATPFALGALRSARALGLVLATDALPIVGKGVDLAAAPRRALLVTLQLAILLLAGAPLAAVTQPFLPSFSGLLLLVVAAALVVALWRSAANLEGHARAGAQVVLEALADQGQAADTMSPLETVRQLVPGLGELSTYKMGPDSGSVGRSLKELNLRGKTGATVLAIERQSEDVALPSANEILQDGDVVVLTGTRQAVTAAKRLLAATPDEEPPPGA